MTDQDDDVVIWSVEHEGWWRPNRLGYTDTLADAGRYTREDADEIVEDANRLEFNECAIPIRALAGWIAVRG